jgi:methionine-rich copper-binding protein CopC
VLRARSSLLAGAAAGALALVVLPLSLASPASAHDELVSTLPADGASVADAPTEVSLTFGEEAQKLGTSVVVIDAAGKRLGDGPVVVDGPLVTQAITPPTVAGKVRVAYRVVSVDGHPVTGTFSFTVSAVSSPSESPSDPASASPSASASPTTAEPTGTTTGATEPSPSTTPASSSVGGSALPWVLGGLAVLALIAAAVATSRRRRAGSSS